MIQPPVPYGVTAGDRGLYLILDQVQEGRYEKRTDL